METVLKAISDWIKSLLTAAIMSNLSGLFDDVNTQVGNIAQQVGTKPSSFEPRVFAMIEALSRNVVLPIAGVILTFIACYELIEMITQHNNMAQFEPALLMKWIFKTAISVWMISNTFDIIMAVFDVTQQVVANSSGIISGNTRVNDIGLSMLQCGNCIVGAKRPTRSITRSPTMLICPPCGRMCRTTRFWKNYFRCSTSPVRRILRGTACRSAM